MKLRHSWIHTEEIETHETYGRDKLRADLVIRFNGTQKKVYIPIYAGIS